MPDLTIEFRRICADALHWERKVLGDSGDEYLVTYGRMFAGPYQYGYHCSCMAYRYSRGAIKSCKHIRQVKGERCTWGEDQGEAGTDERCPYCGNLTEVIRVAV